jgi:hypothetical protein
MLKSVFNAETIQVPKRRIVHSFATYSHDIPHPLTIAVDEMCIASLSIQSLVALHILPL